jgi:hypothetical protein
MRKFIAAILLMFANSAQAGSAPNGPHAGRL